MTTQTVEIPASSSALAISPTDCWQIGQQGTNKAASAPAASKRWAAAGAVDGEGVREDQPVAADMAAPEPGAGVPVQRTDQPALAPERPAARGGAGGGPRTSAGRTPAALRCAPGVAASRDPPRSPQDRASPAAYRLLPACRECDGGQQAMMTARFAAALASRVRSRGSLVSMRSPGLASSTTVASIGSAVPATPSRIPAWRPSC